MSQSLVCLALSGTIIFAVTGCLGTQHGDNINNSTTTIQTPDILFDATSGRTDLSAWAMPQASLNLHQEADVVSWTLGSGLAANARPGGLTAGQLVDGSSSTTVTGSITTELMPAGTRPYVLYQTTGFLGTPGTEVRSVCRSTDGILYSSPPYSGPNLRLFLPKTTTVGTRWRSDMDKSGIVGKAFVYTSLGTVAYRPTIRCQEAAPTPGGDPVIDSFLTAVDASGNPTTDSHAAAIDYTTGAGYAGSWSNIQRTGVFEVLAEGADTPDGQFHGCVKVQLRLSYALSTPKPDDQTSVIGLDQCSGGYTLYWQPGVGWVYWVGSETLPQWGLTTLTSPSVMPNGSFDLGSYNNGYDDGLFVGTYHSLYYNYYQSMYGQAWAAGYGAGYRDVSPYTSYYYSVPARLSQTMALNAYLAQNGMGDASLQNGGATALGRRTSAEPGFIAGYQVGSARYDADYVAVDNYFDTLASGAVDRSNKSLNTNKVPDQFRPDRVLYISGLNSFNVLAGGTLTGTDYPHGYDGMGVTVDAYDPTVTVDPSQLRRKQNASGQELRGIYIALPMMGSITTRSVQGAVTHAGLVTSNG